MRPESFAAILEERGALLAGHFKLSSGRHSERFVQKFRALEDPAVVERIASQLAVSLVGFEPTVVVSAAVGGIVLGYEVARQLGTKAIFTEREGGVSALRRGFALAVTDRVIVVEDVVTTGRSVREVLDVVRRHGANVVAIAAIVRREPVDFGVPTEVLLELPTVSYEPADCPQCAHGEPLQEPGSRYLNRV